MRARTGPSRTFPRLLLGLAVLLSQGAVCVAAARADGPPPPRELTLPPDGVVTVGALRPPGARAPARRIPRRVADPAGLQTHKEQLEQARRTREPFALDERSLPDAGPPGALVRAPAIVGTFMGLRFSDGIGAIPPDTQVAAGPAHVFEVVNVQGRIFTKAGTPLSTFDLNDFFGLPPSTFLFDPKIRFDLASGRWFVVALTDEDTFGTWRLAVSASSDPTGAFVRYSFPTVGSTPDFPALGMSDTTVTLTANIFGCPTVCNGPLLGTAFLVLNKAQLLAGTMPVSATFFPPDQGLFSIQPAHSLSSATIQYLAAVDATTLSTTTLRIWSLTGTPGVGAGVSVTTTDRSVTPLTVPPDAPQQDASRLIVTNDDGLLDAVYRNGSLWLAANTACTPQGDTVVRACLRFTELLTAGLTVSQDITVGSPGTYAYYPAIQTDLANNLIAVFSRSSEAEFASVYTSGRLASDPPNTVRAPVRLKAGEAPYAARRAGFAANFWGDYSGAGIDPADPSTVWVAGEYARIEGGAEWGTWIGQVRLAEGVALGLDLSRTTVVPGEALQVSVSVANFGPAAVVDVSFGVRLPAEVGPTVGCPGGDAIAFLTDGFTGIVVTCLSASPPGSAPLFRSVSIPAGLPVTVLPSFFSLVWPPTLPRGVYGFVITLTASGGLPGSPIAVAADSLSAGP